MLIGSTWFQVLTKRCVLKLLIAGWNDEGETQWFTYHWWNVAQQQQYTTVRPNERFFTINRAFTPGMQRFPATSWTGDPQDCSHETMLRFSMYGQPYHECDMTSEDPTNLVRQYQVRGEPTISSQN